MNHRPSSTAQRVALALPFTHGAIGFLIGVALGETPLAAIGLVFCAAAILLYLKLGD